MISLRPDIRQRVEELQTTGVDAARAEVHRLLAQPESVEGFPTTRFDMDSPDLLG